MANWRELRRFCEREGWELYKSTDHDFYRKPKPDGSYFYTKASRGSKEIPGRLWKEILKKELGCTQEYFNSVV